MLAEQLGPRGLRRKVALKLLTDATGDLEREARIGSLLRHPHLVDVYEVGQDAGTWFCAMEWCAGGSLRQHLPLSPRAVVEVGLQVCEALAYAHEELELVHLDLKPDNLLVQDGVVKVADLGIARARGFASDGKLRGTPRFMAPEQRLGMAVDARADVYALGRVLEELAGGAALDEETLDLDADLQEAPASPSQAWLAPVVARCVTPDPAERFGSMGDLASALAELRVDGPSLASCVGGPTGVDDDVAMDDAFYGREALLQELLAALETPGIVKLKGPGGIGKTRLAREACRRSDRPSVFVDLASARTRAELVQQVASVLSVPLAGGDGEALVGDALDGRGTLWVVVDNMERLQAHGDLIQRWSDGARAATFVVTSRIALGLPGERRIDVPPLDSAESLALLAGRAAERGVDLAGDEAVAELVSRLDGLPLALELAAGRLGVLSPADVLERLNVSLLRSGRLGSSPREATLRGALDWSWELLEPRAREALARLSVFRGGFTLDDAQVVLGGAGALDVLEDLGEHSLLVGREGRLDLLMPVRDYGEERLVELGLERDACSRHGAWLGRYGRRHVWGIDGPAQMRAARAREADRQNLAAAVVRCPGEVGALAALGAAPWLRWRGHLAEGLTLLTTALASAPPNLAPALLVERVGMRTDAGDLDGAGEDLERLAQLPLPEHLRARVAHEAGCRLVVLEAYEEARACLEQARDLLEDLGRSTGRTELSLGAVHRLAGRLDEAEAASRRALAELERVGDLISLTKVLGNLGSIALQGGRLDEAAALHERSLAVAEEIDGPLDRASAHTNLGVVAGMQDRLDDSRTHLEASLAFARASGVRPAVSEQLGNLAEVCLLQGDREGARRYADAAIALRQALGVPVREAYAWYQRARLSLVESDLLACQEHVDRARRLAGEVGLHPGVIRLFRAQLALQRGEPEEALAEATWVAEAASWSPRFHRLAQAVRGEARLVLGDEGGRADLEEAVAALRAQGIPDAIRIGLCCAARGLRDRRLLDEAVALGRPPDGTVAALDLARTRSLLD